MPALNVNDDCFIGHAVQSQCSVFAYEVTGMSSSCGRGSSRCDASLRNLIVEKRYIDMSFADAGCITKKTGFTDQLWPTP